MPKRKNGFTLVELLITVSIIAILSAIALVSYSSFIKNARDTKRKSDLKVIQSALEEYHADQKYYPGSLDFSFNFPLTNSTGGPPRTPSKIYLNRVPIAPAGAIPEYQYKAYKTDGSVCIDSDNAATSTNKCVKYCLYAKMEGSVEMVDLCPDQSGFTLEVTSP